MKLLAIDAATEACSVALLVGDVIYERYVVFPRGHSKLLLNMVDEILTEASVSLKSLDAIAFDRGPGSFTGVRIGTSVTQGLAFGADLPVIPVSSLATIAQGVWREGGHKQVLSVIDARMAEVYWGYYSAEQGIMTLQGAEHISKAEAITPAKGQCFGAGTGWQAYQATLQMAMQLQGTLGVEGKCVGFDPDRLPHAVDILSLAKPLFEAREYVPAEQALPTYLRNEVAKKQSQV